MYLNEICSAISVREPESDKMISESTLDIFEMIQPFVLMLLFFVPFCEIRHKQKKLASILCISCSAARVC